MADPNDPELKSGVRATDAIQDHPPAEPLGETILRFADYERERSFGADVVVIGTGAGGAVVGAELAEAGWSVLFVEEGGYHPTSSFNPYLTESIPRLYRGGSATMIFGRPPIPYVEGRCVGGSTVINGGMAYRAAERVLDRWSRLTRTPDLGPIAMERLYARVEERISMGPQIDESIGEDNRILRDGARRKGWHWQESRRAQRACVGTNSCMLGCPTGAKQSTLVSYVPRALARGARVLTELRADELLIEGGRAVGVVARAIDPSTQRATHRVVVRARAVVVACGAVQTPYLLLRHKLGRPSGLVGRNFTCHPNAKVLALYPHRVQGWKGVSQAGQIREFERDGIVMAENFIPPGALAAHLPFHGEEAWAWMQRYDQMVLSGVLVEDSTTGRVSRSLLGFSRADYSITPHDHERFLRGTRLLGELHFEMGADTLLLPFHDRPVARSIDELHAAIAAQESPKTLELFTPHLMGTASMGSRAESSVVGLDGQVWDLPACYVADASLFPGALGTNPQLTVMALATRVAERLAEKRRAA